LQVNEQTAGQFHDVKKVDQAYFKEKIKQEISKVLATSGMDEFRKVLREELNLTLIELNLEKVGIEAEDIAEGLSLALQKGGSDCLVINQSFQGAMFRCFDPLEEGSIFEKVQGNLKVVEKGIDKILGYLVLTLVDQGDSKQLSNWLGDDDLSHYYFELHVRTLGGVELFIAHEQGRSANIDLDSKSKGLEGKHLIFTKTTPFQWQDDAKLKDTQLEVWNTINDEKERVEYLTNDELEELQAILKQRSVRRRDQENYCLVLKFEDDAVNDKYTKDCSAFLSKLKIPMVRYQVPSKSKPFFGQEQTLMVAVADFLKEFSEYRNL